jgi:prevent-host-death family protein
MRRSEPMTRAIEISEVKSRLSPLMNEVSRNEVRIIVEEAGAPIAALVSLADLERLARFEKQREQRFAVVDRMRAAFADVPTEEIEREAARAVAKVRAEMAAERKAPAQDR